MDKRKLIQIIEKELEELKVLSEEIAEDENDTSLIIELTLSKARLLCQEFELLRELSVKDVSIQPDNLTDEDEPVDEDKYEVSDESISDPELEIVNFEEQESDEAPEGEDDDDFQEEQVDLEDDEPEIDDDDTMDDDLTDDEDQEDEIEFVEEEIEQEGLINFEEIDNIEEIEATKSTVEQTELKTDLQSGVREITIDEMDDEDLEPVKVQGAQNVAERPTMREIPKPEEQLLEKKVVEEPFQKEPSLNDTISENKTAESSLSSGSITSLRAAIGLNDRFLFIREIFGNNTDKYNTIIDQLDKLETQQQAVELLKANITLQKNETSMKFVDLLKRRFSK